MRRQCIKNNSVKDFAKEDLIKKIHDLETEVKVANKLNRNKDSFHVSKYIVDDFAENISEKVAIRFNDRFFGTSIINQTDSYSLSNSSY